MKNLCCLSLIVLWERHLKSMAKVNFMLQIGNFISTKCEIFISCKTEKES